MMKENAITWYFTMTPHVSTFITAKYFVRGKEMVVRGERILKNNKARLENKVEKTKISYRQYVRKCVFVVEEQQSVLSWHTVTLWGLSFYLSNDKTTFLPEGTAKSETFLSLLVVSFVTQCLEMYNDSSFVHANSTTASHTKKSSLALFIWRKTIFFK